MARLLLGTDRQVERQTQARLQTQVANASAGAFAKEIERAVKSAASGYEADGTDATIESNLFGHRDKLQTILLAEWGRAARMAGDRVLGATKCVHGREWVRKQEPSEVFWEQIQLWMAARVVPISGLLAYTTMENVRSGIARGMAAGESVDKIARAIREEAPGIGLYRGMRIARTESHGAYQAGHQASAEVSQLEMEKEWVSSSDGRTRDDRFNHRRADGETVPLQGFFERTGERLFYPGDSSGSAGNTIHCRCGRVDVLK